MDAGILRALKTVKDNRYVQYAGLGLAGLVTQEEQVDKETGQFKRKSKYQLIRISAAVCGIELCYAAETAFVSPILLKLGVPASLMTMVWCLSPIIGFFLVPVMGSLSDRCRLKVGRRRPFIIILSFGIVFGLALVPNGQIFGVFLGDTWNKAPPAPSTHPPPPIQNMQTPSTFIPLPLQRLIPLYPPTKTTDNGVDDGTKSSENKTKSLSASSSLLSISSSLSSPSSSSSPYNKIDSLQQTYPYQYPNYITNRSYNDSINDTNHTNDNPAPLSFSVPSEHLRGIILTIVGVAMLDFNCDACQSPCRAYLLDVSVPEDHSQGLTMFTVMAGAGGAVGYVMGGIDWNSTGFGEAFGGHIRVVFTLVLVAFVICMMSTLTSFREIPLSELNLSAEKIQRSKKRKAKKKYKKFTNEDDDDSSEDETTHPSCKTKYGALSETSTQNIGVGNLDETKMSFTENNTKQFGDLSNLDKPKNTGSSIRTSDNEIGVQTLDSSMNPAQSFSDLRNCSNDSSNLMQGNNSKIDPSSNQSTSLSDRTFEKNGHVNGNIGGNKNTQLIDSSHFIEPTTSPYNMRSNLSNQNDDVIPTIDLLEVSTDVTLKTYLRSIVRMPRCMWVLCLTNLFCWMSLVCYSLYFTDFVGQAVFQGNPQSPVGSQEHNLYDEGIRLGSMGMSLYSLSCAGYSLLIEKLVQRFRAKRVYVLGQLVYTVGMLVMAVSRSKVAVILLSPTAGVMYATLFTMPYLMVAHYHARGMFSQSDHLGGEERQVRGLGTDVAIISSMVFLAQFLLSVFMGTAVSVLRSTTTVVVASSVLSFLGAVSATQVTYLDL